MKLDRRDYMRAALGMAMARAKKEWNRSRDPYATVQTKEVCIAGIVTVTVQFYDEAIVTEAEKLLMPPVQEVD